MINNLKENIQILHQSRLAELNIGLQNTNRWKPISQELKRKDRK